MRRALWIGLSTLLIAGIGGACKDDTKPKKGSDTIEHRAGIPIIPRGKVVAAQSKGERYLLEIEARMPLGQAVAFYRRRLARENWAELRVQKVQPGLWGIAAVRGMFELTGRIKQAKPGVVSIGFERRVRKQAKAVRPPVPKDVPVLKGQITWSGRFFEAPGGRAEIRGRSTLAAAKLTKTLVAALRLKGWTVPRPSATARLEGVKKLTRTLTKDTVKAEARRLQQQGYTVKILSDGKTLDAKRQLVYHVTGVGTGCRVRMVLAYAELTPARARPRPRAAADAGVGRPRPPASANVVPLPKELQLWPTDEPVLGVKRSDKVSSFTLERKCDAPLDLLGEVVKRLKKRGYRPLGAAGGSKHSATLLKGKRVLVVIVSQELGLCSVQLTLLSKAR